MKQIIMAGLLTLIAGCSTTFSNVTPVKNDIWVEITYYEASIVSKLSKETYNEITSGKVTKGLLELKDVHWSTEEERSSES